MLSTVKDVREKLCPFFLVDFQRPIKEDLGHADDSVKGCAQLMGHIGEKLRLMVAGGLDLTTLVLDLLIPLLKFFEQADVLNGNNGLVGKGLEKRYLLAARLCGSQDAQIYRVEGDTMRKMASYGVVSPVIAVGGTLLLSPGLHITRAVLDRQTIHIHDISEPERRKS